MRPAAILGAALVLALAAGCGGDAKTESAPSADPPPSATATTGQPAGAALEPLHHAKCPPAASNCSTAEGTIVYIERVDPDGDGDAHFVLVSAASITGPGISVIDVAKDLRPHPLPDVGDRVSAAGPVYRGHLDQLQIQATEVFTADG